MGTTEMKSDLHKILDRIENEQLLRTVYDFLKQSENAEEGQIWKTLTEEQKREVYLSYEESEDDKNLISWEDIKKKF
jgi:bifunctional N-acetylglucosamine-1-phosphate-uridyltransferase/glucosamine-1-phosphate-acetyltransferase GlmU-like protein